MDDLLKLGVVGWRRGASLAATCADSTGIRVVALCDNAPDAAERAARDTSLPVYPDLDGLLEHDLDAVLLANYFHEHAELAIRCLDAGKHVLSETTPCLTLAEGVALVEAVERSGRTYMLAENYPYMRHNQEMRRLYDAGTIGVFRYGEGEYVHPMSAAEANSLAPGENHWRNWLPVTYYSTHSLAPLIYITGCEPARVNGFAITDDGNDPNRALTRRKMDLAGAIMVTMADGAVAKLLQYDLRGEGNWTRVHGTAGLMENARFGQPGSVRVRREVFDKAPGEPLERLYLPDFPRHHAEAVAAGHGGGDYFVLLEFAEAVRTGRRPFFDVHRAVAMSAVGIQAWRSCLESGAPQPIPDFHDPAERARYARTRSRPTRRARIRRRFASRAMTRAWAPPGWRGRAGVGRVDITPRAGIRARNWGAARHDVAAGIHRTLTLTALALQADAQPLVLITADLGWWRQVEDERAVRAGVTDAHGLAPDQVMLHLTHTHAGPSICSADADLAGGELVPEYLAQLRRAAIEATGIALAGTVPATMTVATGRCDVAVNRDLPCGERFVVGFNPDAPADDTLLVARVAGHDGTVLATLVNYACHPTTLAWENTLISPDFVGALRDVVEAGTGGAPCLFLQGASGELGPREQYTADLEVVDRHGRAIGHAALSAVETLPAPGQGLVFEQVVESGAPLAWWRPRPAEWPETVRSVTCEVPVPARVLPPLAELERQWADIDPASRATRLERAEKLRATYPPDGQLAHPVWVWRVGEVVFVGHPGEAFSLLQSELRRRFAGRPVFVLNLVNGPGWVYLPPRESYRHDKYQVWQTTLGEGSLERVIDETAARIADLLADG